MTKPRTRRRFLQTSLGLAAGLGLAPLGCGRTDPPDPAAGASPAPGAAAAEPLYRISLAQWSLNPLFFSPRRGELSGAAWDRLFDEDPNALVAGAELDPLDFAARARELGIDGIEYVNQFYYDKATDQAYLQELKNRAANEGVESVLIMIDREGELGNPDEAARIQAVENHYKWVDAAAFLGCHAIRVNAYSDGTWEEQQRLAADGLRRLCEYADGPGIDVIVENHGGPSSNGAWLAGMIEMVDHPRAGTLPDFGNFLISDEEGWYDRYQGVQEMMPYARAVSAKSHVFDENGVEAETDFRRMMEIVLDAGYRGWVGIEYEGSELAPVEGTLATKALLERIRDELAAQYA